MHRIYIFLFQYGILDYSEIQIRSHFSSHVLPFSMLKGEHLYFLVLQMKWL